MYSNKKIINKIKENKLTVGIIGLGYVGLPLLIEFGSKRIKAIGFEIDPEKTKLINSGKSYIKHIKDEIILELIESKLIEATCDFSEISKVDAIIICLPTPLTTNRDPDLSYITNFLDLVKDNLKIGQIMSLESTTYPGTSEEIIKPFLDEKGFKVGKDYYLVHSPEREDPGNTHYCINNIPKVLGGYSQECLEVGLSLYGKIVDNLIPVSNLKTAEMTKLLENIHRAVNIGLINELKPIADHLEIDLFEVIDAAASKPFGFVPYYPGPGIGGHCIPIDPFYLTWKAKQFGLHTRFIELAGEINASMPLYVVQKTSELLNNSFKPLKGSKVLILGVAYKKNVDDLRESPSLELINLFLKKGSIVEYSDPHVPFIKKFRKYIFNMKSIKINDSNLKKFDIVLLSTDHDDFEYDLILKYSKLIIDTRGKFPKSKNVYSA